MKLARTDYHVHPNYSIDASPSTIREYCQKALELQLEEICFTTHIELDPVRREKDSFVILKGEKISVFNYVWLDSYFEEITRAQEEFKDRNLRVKAGIEIGYSRGCEKDIEKIINNYPFDYVLGAIHCLDHIAISSMKESPRYFQTKSLAQLARDYFSILQEAVSTGFFDSIAHVDLYTRYGIRHYGPEIFTIHRSFVEPVFAEMAQRGMGLEINTSSRRRGLKEFHPAREMLDLAVKSGIKIFTVGSDAHTLDELGGCLDEALAILKDYKLCNYVFIRRQAVPC
ncbi:MAG TPA: histidinol-phosphatase [Clostridia bacterium]|nr:histidinol-phosphatase [Clostridia bacterium]